MPKFLGSLKLMNCDLIKTYESKEPVITAVMKKRGKLGHCFNILHYSIIFNKFIGSHEFKGGK